MLKILHILLTIIVIAIAGYVLITADHEFLPYMMLFLSLTMLVMGLREFQKENKGNGWIGVATFVFTFCVAFYTFLRI